MKLILNKNDVKKYEEARQRRMTLAEAHEYEDILKFELLELDPENKALKYYGSVWEAISSYTDAINEIRKRAVK